MKKIFTLLSVVLGLSFTSSAQTLTFTHDGEVIPAGSTFMSDNIFYADPSLEDLLGIPIPDEVRPEIFLNCSTNETIVYIMEDIDKVGGIKFCSGGNCLNSGTNGIYEKEVEYIYNGEPLDLQLDFVLPLSGYGTAKAKVTAWVKGKEATTKVSIQVVMSNDPSILSSVSSVDVQNEVKVDNKTLYYHFMSEDNRSLTIYGLNGVQVMKESLNTAHGSVALTELPKGV